MPIRKTGSVFGAATVLIAGFAFDAGACPRSSPYGGYRPAAPSATRHFSASPGRSAVPRTANRAPAANAAPQSAPAPPTSPQAAEPVLPKVPVGGTITIAGRNFGSATGRVVLRVGGIGTPLKVENWEPTSITVAIPAFEVTEPTTAFVQVVPADGRPQDPTPIQLVPPVAAR